MSTEYISTKALAAMLGCHIDTVQRWRINKEGPVPTRIGRHWKYRITDVQNYLDSKTPTGWGEVTNETAD